MDFYSKRFLFAIPKSFFFLFISGADGKFILELARSKEGDRGGWVSVPRKTYWPPAAPSSNNNSVNHNKNESSTSLSCKYITSYELRFRTLKMSFHQFQFPTTTVQFSRHRGSEIIAGSNRHRVETSRKSFACTTTDRRPSFCMQIVLGYRN